MVDVISNMLEVNDSVIAQGARSRSPTKKIVKAIDEYTAKVDLKPGNKITIE